MSAYLNNSFVRHIVNTFKSWPRKRRASENCSNFLKALSSLWCIWQMKSRFRARAIMIASVLSSG